MPDSFTQVSNQSIFGRLIDSIKGVLFGLLLFVAAFVVLFWNEGRVVKTAQSLAEGASAVVSVDPASVDPQNEGKLVHFSGSATTADTVRDAAFPVFAAALKLERTVEMYQWVEDKNSSTHTTVGGSQETSTTYNYSKQWSAEWHNSSAFKEAADHVNPPMPLKNETQTAGKITVGAFTLSSGLVSQITASQPLVPPADAADTVAGGYKKMGPQYYRGANMDAPAVGDVRVTFAAVMPQDVSVVAQQSGSSLKPYPTKAGRDLELLKPGTLTAAQIFKDEEASNQRLTWILRLAGFLAMWFGMMLVLNPFKVMADVIPFMGGLVGAGLFLVTLCVALPLSLVTIAVAWFFYRPLLSIGLLAAAGAAALGIVMILKKRKPGASAAVPA